MNRQRKIVITITYNEMGIIIDTKAEEVAQPNLQPTCNQLATDCISRHAVSAWLDNIGHPEFADVVMDENRFPSAQPEREKGKWIVNETLINCSVCKHSAWSRRTFENIVRGFNFCPNCGADMRGEQDE